MICVNCGILLDGHKKKYCSKKCKNRIFNSRCQAYKNQQLKGMERRLFLIKKKGGACKLCGYNKCKSALTFHHIDSETKSFEIDIRSCRNHSLEKLILEASKCDLLCFNCHMENHYPDKDGWILVPEVACLTVPGGKNKGH